MSNSQIKRTHATRLQPRARKNQVAAVTPVWQEGQPIRILLAEDHTIVRRGISAATRVFRQGAVGVNIEWTRSAPWVTTGR